MSGTDFM